MTPRRIVTFALVWLAVGACVPAATDVRAGPTTYPAPYDVLFTAVLRFVAADSGIPPYNPGGVNGYRRGPSTPWLVVSSDREAGLIVAEARSSAAGFVGSDAPPDVHQLNIVLQDLGGEPPRTAVSVRGTTHTRVFVNRLEAHLFAAFE